MSNYGPFYLYENPPASLQFYPSRQSGSSGGVVIHTTEGSGGAGQALNTAGFISRRSDPGSYHCIVDSTPDSAVFLLPDEAVAFGVAASGFNSRCWMIAIAAPSAALNADSPFTQTEVDNMGREIAAYWQRNGIDAASAAQFIGDDVKNRPGLAHHGDVQPWDRSDAWSRREDRAVFDEMLVRAILRHAGASALSDFQPQPIAPIPDGSVWGMGATGDKVRQIQQIVGVTVDGIYGPQTADGVRRWQSNLGIPADGVWGPQTEGATRDLFTLLMNLPVAPALDENNAFLAALDDARQQILRRGAQGGAVKIAQVTLNARGYPLEGDGIFGPLTEDAVRRFQQDRGLLVDGIIGPQTWGALLQ